MYDLCYSTDILPLYTTKHLVSSNFLNIFFLNKIAFKNRLEFIIGSVEPLNWIKNVGKRVSRKLLKTKLVFIAHQTLQRVCGNKVSSHPAGPPHPFAAPSSQADSLVREWQLSVLLMSHGRSPRMVVSELDTLWRSSRSSVRHHVAPA